MCMPPTPYSYILVFLIPLPVASQVDEQTVASVEELYSCIKRVENSLRAGLGLFR